MSWWFCVGGVGGAGEDASEDEFVDWSLGRHRDGLLLARRCVEISTGRRLSIWRCEIESEARTWLVEAFTSAFC